MTPRSAIAPGVFPSVIASIARQSMTSGCMDCRASLAMTEKVHLKIPTPLVGSLQRPPILHRLGHVGHLHATCADQIGNRAGNLQAAVNTAA